MFSLLRWLLYFANQCCKELSVLSHLDDYDEWGLGELKIQLALVFLYVNHHYYETLPVDTVVH